MYKILVVDDDATCLFVAKACLKKWNYYEARTVNHPLQVLSILHEEEKPYDVVLADVHMPDMDGFELLQHVTTKFNIPVVLISADDKADMMCKGLRNGAPAYLLKPITADHVRHIWQYSVLWKNKEKNTYRRITQATVPRSICRLSSSSNRDTEVKPRKIKAKEKTIWNPDLHTRFVEVMLILGPKNTVPKNILEGMNVQSLTREHVASHLQKFRKFLESILDGKTSLDESSNSWIDCNYYSSIVRGNPNQILIDQLFEKQRTGKTAAPIPASLPLPPFNEAEASSSRNRNIAMLMPNNYTSSSANVARQAPGLDGVTFQHAVKVATPTLGLSDVTFQNGVNVAMPALLGHVGVTYNNHIQNQNYEASEMGYYKRNTVVPQQNYYLANADLQIGNVQFHHNPIIDSSQHDPNNSNSFDADQFGNTSGTNHQKGSIQLDPNIFNSFGGANEFRNALAMPQLGGGAQMVDGGWFINNSSAVNNTPAAAAADYSLLGFEPNQNQEKDWADLLLNFDFSEDEDNNNI